MAWLSMNQRRTFAALVVLMSLILSPALAAGQGAGGTLAASIVGLADAKVQAAVEAWRARQTAAVAKIPVDEPTK